MWMMRQVQQQAVSCTRVFEPHCCYVRENEFISAERQLWFHLKYKLQLCCQLIVTNEQRNGGDLIKIAKSSSSLDRNNKLPSTTSYRAFNNNVIITKYPANKTAVTKLNTKI